MVFTERWNGVPDLIIHMRKLSVRQSVLYGSSYGTISLREIIQYVERKTGKTASLSDFGEEAPYNGEPEYSINTEVAEGLGFQFSTLEDWFFDLLDHYIREVENES